MINIANVSKEYELGEGSFFALKNINLEIATGEFVSILGPSGSGKSTLMHLIGGLDRPSGGRIEVEGQDLAALSDRELAEFRNKKIGFVFQSFHLLPRLPAFDNVVLPLIYSEKKVDRRRQVLEALQKVGLTSKTKNRPSQLSGGEQQRVAIARAIVGDPEIILADEPTGNLDSQTGAQILAILKELNAAGKTVVLVTHDQALTAASDKIYKIRDGILA